MFFKCPCALSYDQVSPVQIPRPQCRSLAPAQGHVDRSALALRDSPIPRFNSPIGCDKKYA